MPPTPECPDCGYEPPRSAASRGGATTCERCGAVFRAEGRDTPARRREDQEGSRGFVWIVAAVVTGVIAIVALTFVPPNALKKPPFKRFGKPPGRGAARRAEEPPAGRREVLRRAFVKVEPVEQKRLAAELRPVFVKLRDAFKAGDGGRLVALFDADRMSDELLAYPEVRQGLGGGERGAFKSGVKIGIEMALRRAAPRWAVEMNWDRTEVRHIKKRGPDELAVITRLTDADGIVIKYRWWFKRAGGRWLVYDFEDLDFAARVTHMMASAAAGVGGSPARLGQLQAAVKEIVQARSALLREDYPEAAESLRRARRHNPTGLIEAQLCLFEGVIRLNDEDFERALAKFDRARSLHPDMPIVGPLRGQALYALGRHAEAVKEVTAYHELLGTFDGTLALRGDALRGLGRFDEAAADYRRSLDMQPANDEAFLGLAFSLGPDGDWADVPGRLKKVPNPASVSAELVTDAIDGERYFVLDKLHGAMRAAAPGSADAAFAGAVAAARSGKPAEALRAFREASDGQADAARRREYERAFYPMVARVDVAAAYKQARRPAAAFRLMADSLLGGWESPRLRELIEAHARRVPGDKWLPVYRGLLHEGEGHFERAAEWFRTAAVDRPAGAAPPEALAARVRAEYRSGAGLDVYGRLSPKVDVFAALASLLVREGRYPELADLVSRHGAAGRDRADWQEYRLLLAMRDGDAAGVVKWTRALGKHADRPGGRRPPEHVMLGYALRFGKPMLGYRLAEDKPGAFTRLAFGLTEPHDAAELRELVAAHREAFPKSPAVLIYETALLCHAGRADDAVRKAEQAWAATPESERGSLMFRLCRWLTAAGRLREVYRVCGRTDNAFHNAANQYEWRKEYRELLDLVKAHRPRAGDRGAVLSYRARAEWGLGRRDAAVATAESAAAALKRPASVWAEFAVVGYKHDGTLDAYRRSADKSEAFGRLVWECGQAGLAELIGMHAGDEKKPANWRLHKARLLLMQDKPAEAEAILAELAAADREDYDADPTRLLVKARVRLKKAVAAYRDGGPFYQVAGECVRRKDAGQLAALIKARLADRPDEDNALAGRRVQVPFLAGKYADAVIAVRADADGVLEWPASRRMRDDVLIRSLVRLGRTDEALKEARAADRRRRFQATLLALAYAAAGDADGCRRVIRERARGPYRVAGFYKDADLGPLLRSERFAAVRAEFPPE